MILSSKGLKTLELIFSRLSDENFGKIKKNLVLRPGSRVFYVGPRVSGLTESRVSVSGPGSRFYHNPKKTEN